MVALPQSSNPLNHSWMTGTLSGVLITTFDGRFTLLVRTLLTIQSKQQHQGLFMAGVRREYIPTFITNMT